MMFGDILVVAPHPDDETLGAGGLLWKAKAAGCRIHWLLVTAATEEEWGAEYVQTQIEQVEAVRNAYSPDSFAWWKLPASGLSAESRGPLIERMRALLAEHRPSTLILPHAGDAHDDHVSAYAVGVAAAKSFRMRSFGLQRILAMEILSETDAAPPVADRMFLPTVIVDISDQLEQKLETLSFYQTELSDTSPRNRSSVEAHARVCGASFGFQAAERFMLLRELVD